MPDLMTAERAEDRHAFAEFARARYVGRRTQELADILRDALRASATRVERGPWAPMSRDERPVPIELDVAWWARETLDDTEAVRLLIIAAEELRQRYAVARANAEAEALSDDYWTDAA